MRVKLSVISFDAGTQVRAALNEQVVSQYADRMTEGDVFPPIVLFHDGTQHYLADGFHRALAATRINWREIEADVRPGTKTDALWFALGANKTHPWQMTQADKRHAILLAIQTWPEKSINQIAEQIGVNQRYASGIKTEVSATTNLPDRVTGKDGKSYPAERKRPERSTPNPKGKGLDKSRAAVAERRERLRVMAAEGYSTRQIAAALGVSEEGCRQIIKGAGVDVVADRAIGNTKHHDANRIVEHIVMDAENLTADVNLIEFSDLDSERLGEWADSLIASKKALDVFIRRLIKEKQKHVEAA